MNNKRDKSYSDKILTKYNRGGMRRFIGQKPVKDEDFYDAATIKKDLLEEIRDIIKETVENVLKEVHERGSSHVRESVVIEKVMSKLEKEPENTFVKLDDGVGLKGKLSDVGKTTICEKDPISEDAINKISKIKKE